MDSNTIDNVTKTVTEATTNETAQAVEAFVTERIPKKVRGVIYDVSKWLGVVGAAVAAAAALLDGTPGLYAGSVGGVLLAVNGFLSKAHLK